MNASFYTPATSSNKGVELTNRAAPAQQNSPQEAALASVSFTTEMFKGPTCEIGGVFYAAAIPVPGVEQITVRNEQEKWINSQCCYDVTLHYSGEVRTNFDGFPLKAISSREQIYSNAA